MRLTNVSTINLTFILFASYLKTVFSEDAVLDDNAAVREDFFSFNAGSETFSGVVDIAVTVSDDNLSILKDHPAWKEYVDFESLSISLSTSADAPFSPNDIVASTATGRIRTKGQSTIYQAGCIGYKNLPFIINFDDAPFLGMEKFSLRTHYQDSSHMRDHAANEILRAIGLPHLKTRPVRLFLNGEYSGFYTLMETPDQDYVMERSFGAFDPEKTGLFKMRRFSSPAYCSGFASSADFDSPVPDPYYFERGRHRDEIIISEAATADERTMECLQFQTEQDAKVIQDVARGYLEYNQSCPVAMVELEQVKRQFGPKSNENSMINFLETYYDQENDDLTDFVDIDQWLQNYAFSAILNHVDSPLFFINNWYLATTDGGNRDWKIFQYDFNNILDKGLFYSFAQPYCAPLMVHMPILRPSFGPNEHIPAVRRILNSENNMEKYLSHVREQMDIIMNGEILDELYRYGEMIGAYASKDDYFSDFYETLEDFENVELTEDNSNYNAFNWSPLLPTLRVRLEEIQKQLDAIDSDTLPRNGEYDPNLLCPDWRNPGVEKLPSHMTDDCPIPKCEENRHNRLGDCFSIFCGDDGEFLNEPCVEAAICGSCFPHSKCGSALDVDESAKFVESDTCGSGLAECAFFAFYFDHLSGYCAFDGEILMLDNFPMSLPCASCFPHSRCGSGDLAPEINAPDDIGSEPLSSASGSHTSLERIFKLMTFGLLWSWMLIAE